MKRRSYYQWMIAFILFVFPSAAFPFCLTYDSFSGTHPDNCTMNLSWVFEECGETGVYYVEYSADLGATWSIIATINSNGSGSYTYSDVFAHPPGAGAVTVEYRIA